MKRILVILISILILGSHAMAYEEANYEIIKENNEYEIRKYSDRLVIETNSIQGNGFRKLFNYISGNNEQKKEIKMTVPVTQEVKNGNTTMQFYLPSKFNKDKFFMLLADFGKLRFEVTTTFCPGKLKKGAFQSRARSLEKTYLFG